MQCFKIVNRINALLQPDGFFERVCEALGIENVRGAKTKIAEIAGISSNAVGLWEKGEMPGRNTLEPLARIADQSNASLHWLLTGEGDPHVLPQKSKEPLVGALRGFILRILAEQAESTEIKVDQDFGSVDVFDLAAEVKSGDNPISILRRWYSHDGITAPDLPQAGAFSGWESLSLEEKVAEIRGARNIVDQMRKFSDAARKSKTPKKIQ
jgi:transcriptional regulator with XRE-family HTH domain